MKKKCCFIINPVSGKKRSLKVFDRIRPVFDEAGFAIFVEITNEPGEATRLAEEARRRDVDILCPIGGDGTIHEVVNGLMKHDPEERIPLGPIPAGSGNALMEDLGCLDPAEAARRIVLGRSRPIDIAEVTWEHGVLYAFNIVGWGFPVSATQTAEYFRWIGGARYTLSALIEIVRRRMVTGELVLEGRSRKGRFLLVIACLTRYTGKGMKAAPSAKLDDGLLDVIVVKEHRRWKLFSLFHQLFRGEHIGDPSVQLCQVPKFAIMKADDERLNVDGEVVSCRFPCSIRVIPRAIELVV